MDRSGAGLAPARSRPSPQPDRKLGGTQMTLWSRAPRQVYEVHGEDDHLAEEAAAPSERTAPQPAANVEGARSNGVLGLTLLVAVTLGAVALVLLALSHPLTGRRPLAERHALPGSMRQAFPHPSTTAPPEVRMPPRSKRHVRASIPPVALPRRRYRRIAGGHSEPQKIVTAPAGDRASGGPASAGGEFDFER